jgi:hypothetical protein
MIDFSPISIPPILVFSCFKSDDYPNRVPLAYPINRFEEEIAALQKEGYTFVSIADICNYAKEARNFADNSICVVFFGGYIDNYTIAFPILKKYGIHADAYLANNLAGYTKYPGIPNFTPHYSWNDANEMQESGLVDIYSLWHPFDSGNELETVIREKLMQIRQSVPRSNPDITFWINTDTDLKKKITALENNSISSYLFPVLATSQRRLKCGGLPYVEVSSEKGLSATIEYFEEVYNRLTQRELTLHDEKKDNITWIPEKCKTILLPIDKNPMARNYLRHAIPLSVIGADRKELAELVVLNDYIEVVFRPWYHWFDYDNYLYDTWNTLVCNVLNRDIVEANEINVAESIIKGLAKGYYADVWMDSYYIPGKPAYQKIHLAHNILIYGYDAEKDKFLSLTYTKSDHYEELEISPLHVLQACSTEYFMRVCFLKRNRESCILYNPEHLVHKLKRYINSDYEPGNYNRYTSYDVNQHINYNACLAFPDYLRDIVHKEHKIYPVTLYSYTEHKRCMAWRLHYIARREGLDISPFTEYESFTNRTCSLILSLGMKSNLTRNDRIIREMQSYIVECNEKEFRTIEELLDSLEEHKT